MAIPSLSSLTGIQKAGIAAGVLGTGFVASKLLGGGGGDVDPSTKDPGATKAGGKHGGKAGGATADAAAGAGAMTDPAAAAAASGAMPTADAAAGAAATGMPAGAQQVGPYTVVPDASGVQIVLDTATQQPVGVLDQAGNLVPIDEVMGGAPTGAATSPAASMDAGAASSSDYEALAQSLFANPATVGGGATAAMPTGAPTSASGVPSDLEAAAAAQGLTLVPDEASGLLIAADSTTGEPVGVVDEASGSMIPMDEAMAMMDPAAAGATSAAAPVARTSAPTATAATAPPIAG